MRINQMKRNPRDEDLYTILYQGIQNRKWIQTILQDLVECEQLTTNTILIIDMKEKKGIKIKVIPKTNDEGLVPIKVNKVYMLETTDDWEQLPKALGECTDTRIIKDEPIVLVECTEPDLNTKYIVEEVKKMEQPLVECYYEWEQ